MQNARKEDEASNQAYEAHEALLEECISPGPQAQTKGAKIPRYQKETKVCKPKERAETEKDTGPCNKSGRRTKRVVKQVLDGASDAKCQIDPKVIEETYAERFESVGRTVDLSNHPGPFIEPPLPPTTSKKDCDTKQTHADPNGQTRRAEPSCDRILDAVTASEVKKAVSAMRTGSAAGPDRITVLKRKAEETQGFLAGMYTIWLMTGKVPEKLKASRSLLQPKGATDMQNIGNWRLLSISSVLLRLYTKILAKRLTSAIRLHPSQRSFTPVPGVKQNSVLLEHLIWKQKKERGTLVMAFLDLAKAVDTISHDLFAKGLMRLGVPTQIIKVVEDLYHGATTTFTAGNGETRQIKINQGVKQGDPLSLILFNMCLDPLFCSLERDGKGWGSGETTLMALGYADDTAVLSDSRAGLKKQQLVLVKTYCDQVDLRLNVNKSYVFHIYTIGWEEPSSSHPIVYGSHCLPIQSYMEDIHGQ